MSYLLQRAIYFLTGRLGDEDFVVVFVYAINTRMAGSDSFVVGGSRYCLPTTFFSARLVQESLEGLLLVGEQV